MAPKKLYRFVDHHGYVALDIYKIVKKTPCGYWVEKVHDYDDLDMIYDHPIKRWWVSEDFKKRRAYPTIQLAIESFIARKKAQIKYKEGEIVFAKDSLEKGRALLKFKNLDKNKFLEKLEEINNQAQSKDVAYLFDYKE